MVDKVLVANRSAIARRVIRACHDLGLASVALYSEADADAPYLAEASQALPLPGHQALETYLNQDLILRAAEQSGADSIHPGYGFLSENAEFAARVVKQGLTFIGPDPKWLAAMGDKVAARKLFADQGFPVFAGSDRLADEDSARQEAERIGYPVMLKPAGGGGGMGMEVVHDPEQLSNALQRAKTIAQRAFGDGAVYLERWLSHPRHIEIQVMGDGQGRALHLFERECSVQRRNQKLIEESPAPNISRSQVVELAENAARVCTQLGYNNVGTLETLFTRQSAAQPSTAQAGEFGFLEMNTRIQVEHGVTEMVTGVDLVQQQILLAGGAGLPVEVKQQGFAIEARVYAEDAQTLLPSTGQLHRFHYPRLFGVRVETGYQQGQIVTPYYDALLAKVIACGDTREMAIGRLLVALQAFEIVGVSTNIVLLQKVLKDPCFLAGEVDTGIIARMLGE